jgi:serine/threonine-protein kinase
MQPQASPPGAERDAELDVPYRAPAPLPSARTLFADAGWRFIERVGAGGSSDVWHALDPRGRAVALKIPRAAPRPEDARAPLAREHELLASVRHAHIVATFGLIERSGVCALALEYLPGGDLVALAGAHPRHWLPAARELHAALEHLHARGYAHRDVKARNVLFDARGRARLIDFASALPIGARAPSGGTTSAHRRGGLIATVTAADDAYAFAVLLYELLAGRLPYGPAGRAAIPASSSASAPSWPLAGRPPAGAAVKALADRVLEVLEADGRDGPGVSAFADVLESAAAAHAPPPRFDRA